MRRGAYLLACFPLAVVRVECSRCGRSGQYRLSSLVSRFGGDAALPDVLAQLAHCDRRGSFSTPCGAKFSDLTGRAE
jgi:uncharacterized protein with von Willebrand factor type A (vWA) domain